MPWSVKKDDRCPASKPWAVIKEDDNALEGCHMTQEMAETQQAALYANEGRSESNQEMLEAGAMRPPRDNLVRSIMPGVELREAEDDSRPILNGHFAVFNQWTEIDSAFEGHFMERLAPGAFAQAFLVKRDKIRALFQHGQDPQIGNKPLGPFQELREDKVGGYYEVPLLDTSYNRDLLPGLRAGLYGSSFRFSVIKEQFERNAPKSAYNPDGLPERTLQEVDLWILAVLKQGADLVALDEEGLGEGTRRQPLHEVALERAVDLSPLVEDSEVPAQDRPAVTFCFAQLNARHDATD
jgi:HK97 family phage prohead protease